MTDETITKAGQAATKKAVIIANETKVRNVIEAHNTNDQRNDPTETAIVIVIMIVGTVVDLQVQKSIIGTLEHVHLTAVILQQ